MIDRRRLENLPLLLASRGIVGKGTGETTVRAGMCMTVGGRATFTAGLEGYFSNVVTLVCTTLASINFSASLVAMSTPISPRAPWLATGSAPQAADLEPNSPLEQDKHNASQTQSLSVRVKNPTLFPVQEAPSRPLRLFGPQENAVTEHDTDIIIHEYFRATGLCKEDQRLTEEHRMVLRFESNVTRQFQADQVRWLNHRHL